MGYGDDYWGLYRDYYRDPFPHSLLSTREFGLVRVWGFRVQGFRELGCSSAVALSSGGFRVTLLKGALNGF